MRCGGLRDDANDGKRIGGAMDGALNGMLEGRKKWSGLVLDVPVVEKHASLWDKVSMQIAKCMQNAKWLLGSAFDRLWLNKSHQ